MTSDFRTIAPQRNQSEGSQTIQLICMTVGTKLTPNTASLVASTTGLCYYDPQLPVTLQVDASDNAVGGVLLHEGHTVHFTSHTLTNTERNYAQIEKRCLAIVSCMDKWHHYLCGKHDIKVHSDHQPLDNF